MIYTRVLGGDIGKIIHNSVYRRPGLCGRDLHCYVYKDNNSEHISCYKKDLSTGFATPGELPECIKCLTETCAELKRSPLDLVWE